MPPSNLLDYRVHRLADAALTPLVKYVWTMRSQEMVSPPDLLIPDGYPEIIFVQQGAYCKAYLDANEPPSVIDRSCAIGIQTRSVLASRLYCCRLVGIKLTPPGAYALLGGRLGDLADCNVPLDELGVDWLASLDQRLQTCPTAEQAVAMVREGLQQQIQSLGEPPLDPLAESLLRSVLQAKGQLKVQALAEANRLSVRHLQRRFKAYFGVSPKQFLTLIRFKYLYKASILQAEPSADFWAYGYYDQMHFIKDFRRHLGVTPSQSSTSLFRALNEMARRNT